MTTPPSVPYLRPRFTHLPLALASLVGIGASVAACGAPASREENGPSSKAPAPAPAPPRAAVTTLQGSLHPAARPERDLGRMDPTIGLTNLSLLFQRTPAQSKQLARDMVAIQDPASPSYHQWLSAKEFGARYGAAPADVARVRAWLSQQGFSGFDVPETRSRIAFSGTVGQLERAFSTEMHRYQVRGAGHFALAYPPSIPASLGRVVAGLHGAHDLRMAPPYHPRATYEGQLALAPLDFSAIYDVAPLYANGITGAGQSIAIVGESAYNHDDILAFRQSFNLDTSIVPMDVLVPNTGNSEVLDPGDVEETTLDLEWSGAVAKEAQLYFVYTGDSTNGYGFFDSIVYAVEQRIAPIVSVSYGGCEKGMTPSDAVYYGQVGDLAAMTGVSVVVASGDTGAAGCDGEQESSATEGLFVDYPASIPTVLAVGGTQFNFDEATQSTYWNGSSQATGYIPEVGWNQTFLPKSEGLGASGGGYSVIFPRPYWQASALPNSMFRGVPDVALTASSSTVPYLISESWTADDGPGQTPFAEQIEAIGGTSASTPSFAGILALVNQAIGAKNPGLGVVAPTLYSLYVSAPLAFHDITSGSNVVPCITGSDDCSSGTDEYGYNAAKGYDLVTGLGSVDAYNLVTAWSTLAPTSTALTVTGAGGAEGTPITLSATVASNATAHPLTGKVTFYFDTPNAAGSSPDLAYVLGDVDVTGDTGDAGTYGATATLTTTAPVGLTGSSSIVAFYGGDGEYYLASYSTPVGVTTTTTFAVSPSAATLQPNQETTFTASGGVAPVSWNISSDDTCSTHGYPCAEIKTLSPTTVELQAGPNPGSITLQALDTDFAEALVTISVSGTPVDAGRLIPPEAGVDAGRDAGNQTGLDATPGQPDASGSPDTGPSDSATDSGKKSEGGPTADSGPGPDAMVTSVEDGGEKHDGGAEPRSSGGCVIAPRESPDAGWVLAFGFSLVGMRRRRARR